MAVPDCAPNLVEPDVGRGQIELAPQFGMQVALAMAAT
jgi:hypothetical protein